MAEIMGWLIAGAAAVVAFLFGGAWLHERKQRKRAGADYNELSKANVRQRLKIAALTIRAREADAIRKRTREGIKDMADHARNSTLADDLTARIRGPKNR